MKRRNFFLSSFAASLGALSPASGATSIQALPRRGRIRVAFMLGNDTNVIDTAGPWEVFQDVMVMAEGAHSNPFELITVGPSREPLTMTAGLKVVPLYTFQDAPRTEVVVVPAQRADDAARAWLRNRAKHADMVFSVCTGAYQLARAGLLDGLAATTHHDFWDDFARQFPAIRLDRGQRFVDNGRIATSGGLTSGIDLALHVVARYFDMATARATARYLEHESPLWQ
jgi:transcriptional regulator GlxA family with amidase domain